MKKPNLFIVGHPKSGTTALYNFLRQHPDIFMSLIKEPCFFCKDLIRESDLFHTQKRFYLDDWSREQAAYLSLFADVKSEKIIGECSTSYLYSKVAAAEIHKFNPHAKIIILLREPVSFLRSSYSQRLLTARENAKDFKTSVSLEKQRKLGQDIPSTIKRPSAMFHTDRIKYCQQVARYYDLFGKSNVKVIIYEDFKENNKVIYNEILKFLCVNTNFVPEFDQYNISKKPRFVLLNKMLKNSALIRKLKNIIPQSVWQKITPQINKALLKREPRKALDPELQRELMREFKPEVVKISGFLGIDLVKRWNYDRIR